MTEEAATMPLPSDVLSIVLEYVAEVSHHKDPWLWRLRLVNKQLSILADSLIWKKLYIKRVEPRLAAAGTFVREYQSAPKGLEIKGTEAIKKAFYDKLTDPLALATVPKEDYKGCLLIGQVAMDMRPNRWFEIVHNIWSAHLFPEEYPELKGLCKSEQIDRDTLDKQYNALNSKFTGYVAPFEGRHYTCTITEARLNKSTYEIIERHASHVRTVVHEYMGATKSVEFMPVFRKIASECLNLERIELAAQGSAYPIASVETQARDMVKVLKLFVGHPNVSSIALGTQKEAPKVELVVYSDSELAISDHEDDDNPAVAKRQNRIVSELASPVRKFKNSPAVELDLHLKHNTAALRFANLVAYRDSNIRYCDSYRVRFQNCMSLKEVSISVNT